MTVRDGRLWITARGIPLTALLPILSERTGVKLIEAAALGDQRVSITLEATPIEEALRQILSGCDTFFYYGRMSDMPARLRTIWIYPEREGHALAPIDATTAVSTAEFLQATSDPNPIIRVQALQQLVERTEGSEIAAEALARALQDPEELVRVTAIDTATNSGIELPDKELKALALADAAPHVRLRALKALVNSPELRAVAEAAAADGNEDVRLMARKILETLDQRKGGR